MTNWAQDAVFYHLYPLGLCGAPARNDFHSQPVPRLERVRPWLAHAQTMRATALYLGPVFESTKHGYDTADYGLVDRRLGDAPLLASVVSEAHRRGMKVLFDAVFGHVGRDFHAFRDVQQRGEASPRCAWFRGLRFDRRSPHGDAFTYEWWRQSTTLPRLDLANPEVREHLFGAVDQWIRDYDIDGLRLDTADCLDLDFLRALRAHCDRVRPGFFLLGEVIHGDYRDWVNPETLHSVTNYQAYKGLWSSLNDRNYFEIAWSLDRQFGASGQYRGLPLYEFVDNHDVDRAATALTNRAHLFPLYCLLFTMPGMPSIYYGSEWGLAGRRTPTDDHALRPCLSPSEAGALGDPALLDAIRRLAGLRAATPALRRGDYAQLHVAAEQLAFSRRTDDATVLVALNAASTEATLELDLPGARRLTGLLDPGAIELDAGRARLTVPPGWARVMRVDR